MISTQTAGDTLFIRVNGPITSQSEEALWQIGKAQHVVVIIDSCGGNAEALSSLAGALLAHDDTRSHIIGVAYSGAALVARSCQICTAVPTAKIMFHRSNTACAGTADDLRSAAAQLDAFDQVKDLILTFRKVPFDVVKISNGPDYFFDAQEAIKARLIDALSNTNPTWTALNWPTEPDQPATTDEDKIINILNALPTIIVASKQTFSERVYRWFQSKVIEAGGTETPYKTQDLGRN